MRPQRQPPSILSAMKPFPFYAANWAPRAERARFRITLRSRMRMLSVLSRRRRTVAADACKSKRDGADASGHVQARLALEADRLQREGAAQSADQNIRAH